MKRLIVANWKMHSGPSQASILVTKLAAAIAPDPDTTVVLCPPSLDLFALAADAQKGQFKLGAQNLYFEDEGAFTGEISGPMLQGLADYVIVGHSERRRLFGEDDALVAKKVVAAIRNQLIPILCIGENLTQRESHLAEKVVVDQLSAAVHGLGPEDLARLVVAYEPVWALSTTVNGRPATPSDVEPMMKLITTTLAGRYGADVAADVRLLYGGSVNDEDARAYLALPDVDGLLVGGASLIAEKFARIVEAAQSL